jgi:hypothetical protein
LLPSTRLHVGLLFALVVEFFFVFYATNPYSGIRAVFMHRYVARVEHNGFVGVDALVVICFSCNLHLTIWWDEAAQANLT